MCKELAKELRSKLKELGYNRTMVSVTSDYNSMQINIKSIEVDFKKVAELANNYKKIRTDHSGDILQGGNIFVSIDYAESLMESLENKYMSKAQETFEAIQNSNELENIFIKDGIYAFLGDFHMIWFRVPQVDGTVKRYKCYNCVEGIAEVFAKLFLNENIDMMETSEPFQEPSIVETLKTESQEIISSINTETLETQKVSFNAIDTQLDKINKTINNNLENEEIRLQLRDIENNLKWHYSSLDELIESQNNNSDILDLTNVNFNDINQLITLISNWNELPQNVQNSIKNANNFYIYGTSLMLYVDYKALAEAGIYINNNKIEIECIGFKDGLQWNQDDEPTETQQESKLKITIDGEGFRKKVSYNNFKGANYEIGLRCDQTQGYNKTWITIELNNKIICNHVRIDLTIKDKLKGLKELLTTNAENSINYYKNYSMIKDEDKKLECIAELEKFIKIINALDNEGKFKTQYNYTFWHNGAKVWEYTLDELQEDSYTETTLKILSGEVEGYGKPIENCRKEDIIVKIQELNVAV